MTQPHRQPQQKDDFEPLERQATLPLADPVGLVAGLPQLEPRTSRASRISRSRSLRDKDGLAAGQPRRGSDIPESEADGDEVDDEKRRELEGQVVDDGESGAQLVKDVPPNGGAKAWTVVFGTSTHHALSATDSEGPYSYLANRHDVADLVRRIPDSLCRIRHDQRYRRFSDILPHRAPQRVLRVCSPAPLPLAYLCVQYDADSQLSGIVDHIGPDIPHLWRVMLHRLPL